MNQDDFRKLLSSSGGTGAGGGRRHGSAGASSGNITSLDANGIRKLSAKKSSKKKGNKPHKGGDADGDGDKHDRARVAQSQYRDRAAERREGAATDMIDADEFKHLNADQSKFLGGDTEHTHLVKGLDFALLAQLKREKQKLEHATAAEKLKRNGGAASDVHPSKSEGDTGAEPTFQTRMGRMVYFHACQNRPLNKDAKWTKSELFLPGRMYYTFNLLSTDFESVPLAVQRSKDDCPELDDVVSGLVDELTISEVRRAMEEKATHKKMRRKRDETTATNDGAGKLNPQDEINAVEPTKPPVVEDDDDDLDIFPDAGEYVPAYLRLEEKPATDMTKGSKGYFTNLSASLTEAEKEARQQEEEAERAWKATLQKAAAAQAQAEKEEAMRARAAKLAANLDSYGDDYQMGGEGDSDEDDEEQSARKRKSAADGKKGAAGATEVGEEEKTRRKKQKQGNKLENDLKKINKVRSGLPRE
jgi:IK cytokine